MKKLRKTLSLLLATLMLASAIPLAALADGAVQEPSQSNESSETVLPPFVEDALSSENPAVDNPIPEPPATADENATSSEALPTPEMSVESTSEPPDSADEGAASTPAISEPTEIPKATPDATPQPTEEPAAILSPTPTAEPMESLNPAPSVTPEPTSVPTPTIQPTPKPVYVPGYEVSDSERGGSLLWPVERQFGTISQGFEVGKHNGIDISADKGTSVYASESGIVSGLQVWNGTTVTGEQSYGNKIELTHENGIVTVYAHLSSFAVQLGESVEAGQVIGTVGSTGNSTGSHLHFMVVNNGTYDNPRDYITGDEYTRAESRFNELLAQYGGYINENGKLRSNNGKEVIDKSLAEIYEEAGFPQISFYANDITVTEDKSTYVGNIGFDTNVESTNGWGGKRISGTNKVAYCVEHGVSLGINNNPGYSENDLTKEQRDRLSLIDYWGRYRNIANIQAPANAVNSDYQPMTVSAQYMAEFYCQLLIWETINSWGGSFIGASYVSLPETTGGIDNIAKQSTYDSFKTAVMAKVNQFYTTPSISGQTVKLKPGETKQLIDTTGTLASYKDIPIANTSGVSVAKNGNTVSITATGTPNALGKIVFSYAIDREFVSQGTGFYYRHPTTQGVVSCGFSGGDPTSMTLNVEVELYGSAKIVKTSEDGIVSGLKFKVTGNGVDSTVTTGTDGVITVPNLLPGVYTVSEMSTPGRYKQPESKEITVSPNTTATVSFNNVLKRGALKIAKTSEDGIISGFKFKVTGNGMDTTVTTGTDGTITVPNLLPGVYTVSEVSTPGRYSPPQSKQVTIAADSTAAVTFNNTLKKGSLTVQKSAEDGEVKGCTFHVTSSYAGYGKSEWDITTNDRGVAALTDIPLYDKSNALIKYTVQETDVPIRYTDPMGQTTTIEGSPTLSFNNVLKKGSLSVKKIAQDNETEGRTFRVKADFGYNGKDTWDIKSDKTGKAKLEGLPLYNKKGALIQYTVEETDVPIRYITPDKQTVTVEKTPELPFNNKLKEGYIQIVKESEDGEINGVTFTIKSNYSGYGKDTWEIVTDEKGYALSERLPAYDKDGQEIKYTVNEKNVEIRYVEPDSQVTALQQELKSTLTFKNKLKKGFISIVKESEDDVIVGVRFTVKSNYSGYGQDTWEMVTAENGTAMIGGLPVYDKEGKEIQYTVEETGTQLRYIDLDGQETTLQHGLKSTLTFKNLLKKGKILINKESEDSEVEGMKFKLSGNGKEYTGATDNKGQLVFDDLDIYDIHNEKIVYMITEYDVPIRYIKPEAQTATIPDPDKEHSDDSPTPPPTESTDSTDHSNPTQKNELNYSMAPNRPMKLSIGNIGAFFASVSSVSQTNIDRQHKQAMRFSLSKASLGLSVASKPSVPSDQPFSESTVNFMNTLKKGTVTTTKVNANDTDRKLSGATFGIYRDAEEGSAYTAATDTRIGTMEETSTGFYELKNLPFGRYFIHEDKAPEGFIQDDNYYSFEISEDGQVVDFEIHPGKKFPNYPSKTVGWKIPKTGDNRLNMTILFSFLTLLATGAAVGIVVYKRRKRQ